MKKHQTSKEHDKHYLSADIIVAGDGTIIWPDKEAIEALRAKMPAEGVQQKILWGVDPKLRQHIRALKLSQLS